MGSAALSRYHTKGRALDQRYVRGGGPDLDADDFEALVAEQLRSEGGLIDLWETFSADTRGTPASYLVGTEVGYFDGQ
jgi:hypothetical protein